MKKAIIIMGVLVSMSLFARERLNVSCGGSGGEDRVTTINKIIGDTGISKIGIIEPSFIIDPTWKK